MLGRKKQAEKMQEFNYNNRRQIVLVQTVRNLNEHLKGVENNLSIYFYLGDYSPLGFYPTSMLHNPTFHLIIISNPFHF